jgi:phosphonate transport system substrate-binding protein
MTTRRLLLGLGALHGLGLGPHGLASPARAQPSPPAMPAPSRRPWAAQVPVPSIGILGGESEADRLGR